jgi:ATP-dependent helicase HrpB
VELPIDTVLPRLVEALCERQAAVLTAPPGAGKTTRVPLALLEAGLAGEGQIVVLQPRRLATRAVARMMARSLDEPVGQTVGYRVRFEDRSSAKTRVLVVTEGILTRRLLVDPVLDGVGCVVLDEFHERSIHADLALAFLRELLEVRDDLRLVVMSATLSTEPLVRFLGGCPVVTGEVRQHPLEIEHLGGTGRRGDRHALARAVRRGLLSALDASDGDVLVFLPGAPEINVTLAHLRESPLPAPLPELIPLHGSLPAAEQDRALSREPGKPRRVVLATNIAETSLTVPGVTAVVDSGLHKQPRFDEGLGLDRLELSRISQASATQRAGRAGRLGPGRALRLYDPSDPLGADTPEIQRVDLAGPLLSVLSFHPGDPQRFEFFESPGSSRIQTALALLRRLGAVEPTGFELTDLGRRLAYLPVQPRVGAMLEAARKDAIGREGALLAALLSERDLLVGSVETPTCDSDLLHRRELCLELEQHGFGEQAARRLGIDLRAAQAVRRARDQLARLAGGEGGAGAGSAAPSTPKPKSGTPTQKQLLQLPLAGFPDRVCRRRAPQSAEATMVGGRGVRLAESSGVREAELFLALQAEAGRRGTHAKSLVRLASAVELDDLEALFPALLRLEEHTLYDAERDRVVGIRRRLFDDLVLHQAEGIRVDPDRAVEALAAAIPQRFDQLFRPDRRARQLVARLRLAARHLAEEAPWPDATAELLAELCAERGFRSLDELRRLDWLEVLSGRLTYHQRRRLDRALPERLQVPSGRSIAVDYDAALGAAGEPVLAVKLQELFGLADTPSVLDGRLPLLLHLLAPNGRPVQVTRDLRSFWEKTYPEVRKDLRGRYPRHPWPEDPWTAPATARTRPRR